MHPGRNYSKRKGTMRQEGQRDPQQQPFTLNPAAKEFRVPQNNQVLLSESFPFQQFENPNNYASCASHCAQPSPSSQAQCTSQVKLESNAHQQTPTHVDLLRSRPDARKNKRNQKRELYAKSEPQQQFATLNNLCSDELLTKKNLYAMVRAFVDDPCSDELSFPPTLTATERHMVHQAALNFNLHHKSKGEKDNRVLTLRKIGTVAKQRKEQEEAARDGHRVKVFDGYQGAQSLPDTFVKFRAHEVDALIKPLLMKMYHHLKSDKGVFSKRRHWTVSQPGMSSVPKGNISPKRYEELQKFRRALPSYKRKNDIINMVKNNLVTIVSGDTGCGKTTQVPQILYESNIFDKDLEIICTQPRRISALSVAQRVAEERGEACGDSCGYVIRFENVTSQRSKVVYMTTGILLRRLHTDPHLPGVSCIVVDEVHERDVETDFCLLLLRDRIMEQQRHQKTYKPIKVVVMSATVQLERVTSYFAAVNHGRAPPVISIPGTLFPVQEFFLEDALKWTKMNSSCVPAMSLGSVVAESDMNYINGDENDQWAMYEKMKSTVLQEADRDPESLVPYELVLQLITYFHRASGDLSGSILVFLPGWAAIDRISNMIRRSPIAKELSVLQLHSSLTSAEQQRVFYPPPKRYRKVVLSTNIAETSITIDDAVYVIDSCLTKGTSYDPTGNTSALKATFIAKANGIQRRGRAGRCRAGVCVHLLPRSAYNSLPEFLKPAIMRTPLEEVCLHIKALKPDEMCVEVLSRALDSPPEDSTAHAVKFLEDMGALTSEKEELTNLGRALAKLPVHPLLGKMLLAAACLGVLDPIATIAAYLTGKTPFIKPMPHQKAGMRNMMQHIDNGQLSDHLCVLKVFDEWKKNGCRADFAIDHYADQTTLRSMDRVRKQLLRLVSTSSLLRRIKDPMRVASRHSNNMGLVRMAALWSLYPRIASIEYRAIRRQRKPEVYCWDNKVSQFTMGSALAMRNRGDFDDRGFVFYNERMQLETTLTLFDATAVTPVEVALCLRELTVRPLTDVPGAFLEDNESKMGPAFPFSVPMEEDDLGVLFFDGDKKLYVTSMPIALTIRNVRDCMDYYLALAIHEVRADLFPETLTRALSYIIGYPIKDDACDEAAIVTPEPGNDEEAEKGGGEVLTDRKIGGNSNYMFSGGADASGDEDDYDDADTSAIMMDDLENFTLTKEEIMRATSTLGDLAVFNRFGGARLLEAFTEGERLRRVQSIEIKGSEVNDEKEVESKIYGAEIDDEESDGDDVIVAQAGQLVMEDDY